MPTETTKLKLGKPIVNSASDADQWGDILNETIDDLDNSIPLTSSVKSASFAVGSTEFNYLFLVNASSSAVTASLPASSDVYNGFKVIIKATDATNTITIDPNLAETIDGESTITLDNNNDVVELVNDGSNWQLSTRVPEIEISYATNTQSNAGTVDNIALVPSNFGSQQTVAANGYQDLPGGIIMQWGTYTNNSSAQQTHNFPKAFTNNCFSLQATVSENFNSGNESVTIFDISTTTFSATTASNDSGTAGITYTIFAIGN
jgi:hypothetical protein